MIAPIVPPALDVVERGPDLVRVDGDRISIYSKERRFDTWLAGAMIIIGLVLVATGMEISVGTDDSLTAGWSTATWATILLVLGPVRLAAIIINGRKRQSWSARVRAVTAFGGAIFWVGIATLTLEDHQILNAAFFSWLTWGEIRCAIRALKEAALIRQRKLEVRARDAAGTGV